MNSSLIPIKNEALNERDYGDLIGQNKKEAAIWKPIDENLSQLDFCSFIESCNFFSR